MNKSLDQTFKPYLKDDNKQGSLTTEQQSLIQSAVNVRKQSISNTDTARKYSSKSGALSLLHQTAKVQTDKDFMEGISQTLKDIVERLNYDKVNA